MRWNEAEYTGWGRVRRASGRRARPEKVTSLKAILKDAPSPAIGNLRSYGDQALNTGGGAIDMTRLDRLIAFDPETGVLAAEAGITIGEIVRVFAPRGWIPTVMPGTGFATLGGAIANDVHGKNHHVSGSFGSHVLSIELVGASGRSRKLTRGGTPDLFRSTVGGMGQTGVILSAAIQMQRCASEIMQVRESRVEGLAEFLTLLDQSSADHVVGWIDATATGAGLGRGILEQAEIKAGAEPIGKRRPKSVPVNAPRFLLSPPIVRLFNRFYLRRVPVAGRHIERRLEDFFFPLDRIHHWNRLYGKPGFHQFQCVLPEDTAPDTLVRMLTRIGDAGVASPLAVLKRLGEGQAGLMSFTMPGYTLAVDFPNRAGTAPLIAELEAMTESAGGRIYLAKDALMSAGSLGRMYPDLPDFQRIVQKADPDGRFLTDMARRLNLRGETT
ncbi:MAG: FAD-binding oxidoreductase [Rhodobacteraceae bacterium]|nr:FAD-binding oxidoreductase [Paracoccaceae bacterium]